MCAWKGGLVTFLPPQPHLNHPPWCTQLLDPLRDMRQVVIGAPFAVEPVCVCVSTYSLGQIARVDIFRVHECVVVSVVPHNYLPIVVW